MRQLARALGMLLLIAAGPLRADPVSDWAEFADAVETAASVADAPFDAATAQAGSKVALAMFEAADAVDRRYRSWLTLPPAAAGAAGPVAVATAAHDVLAALYPAQQAAIDDRYALALVDVPEGAARAGGIAAGRRAAVAALAAGGIDGRVPLIPYAPATPPGVWVPTTPTSIDAHFAAIRPWFMTGAAQFRPGPPVALDSARWVKDVDEVRRMGGRASTERSAAETVRARFWAPYDAAPAFRAVAAQPGRSLVRNARFYALIAMASDDMGVALADGKLHYGFWRPVTAIRAGGGNPAIKADPGWEPLLRTPMHPEYPCGHCVVAAVWGTIIAAEGTPAGGLPFANAKMPGVTVTVPTTDEYIRQVSFSRICAGVHYRSTAEISEAMGKQLARQAIAAFAPPLAR